MSASISLNDAAAARAWFADVVEPLADSFDPANVDRYVRLFADVLEQAGAGRASDIAARYERVRAARHFTGPDPADVFVLSRVTLGADAAITSVLLDAAKRRFPKARVWFAGSAKGRELFIGDARIGHAPAGYQRTGSIADRIAASVSLQTVLDRPGAIVIDPDSRLTQLGLVPVCAEDRYYFFETRASTEPGTLGELASQWAQRTFGVDGARAWLAPPAASVTADIAVSLGVGENPAKRLNDPFERRLLESLAALGATVVDRGAGGEESERVERASQGLSNVSLFEGSFAAFAGIVKASRAYVGYDSAGQHAAAACGTPLATVFAGYPNQRFLERWRPSGAGPSEILRADRMPPQEIVARVTELAAGWLKPYKS
ncbi:MAG: hypothetical protein JSU00_05710 [Acidobacteria bacterium]|nr:hypothetical protein [Acidobacteriota bacterium]